VKLTAADVHGLRHVNGFEGASPAVLTLIYTHLTAVELQVKTFTFI